MKKAFFGSQREGFNFGCCPWLITLYGIKMRVGSRSNVLSLVGLAVLGAATWMATKQLPKWGWVLAGIFILGPVSMLGPSAFVRTPGIIECQFHDADGQIHSIIGKLPYFTGADLWFDSDYPQPGEVECRVLGSLANGTVRIALAEETTDGRSEVVVPETNLIV